MKKRLFIESDVLHQYEVDSCANCVEFILQDMGIPFIPAIFDKAIGYAWHDMDTTWEEILLHDEVFASSSLFGLSGARTYIGSPPLFDGMMKRALDNKVKGKSLYFLTHSDDILWDNINLKMLVKVFATKNKLYCTDKKNGLFVHINPHEIAKKYKK